MPIGQLPGKLGGYIHCRHCSRCVHVDTDTLLPAPVTERYRLRLRCSASGGRGADIRIGWTIPPPQQVAVIEKSPARGRASRRRVQGELCSPASHDT